MDWDTFKCLTGDECIRASGRCNGVNNCGDGSDEVGCDTYWGVPAVMGEQECNTPFSTDVQFQCATGGMCAPAAGKCNGVANCADGSDETGCATTTTELTIEAMTGYTATIVTPAINEAVFHDRTYIFDNLGSFTGQSFIKMSNEDKHIRHSHVQMKLRLEQPTTVYIAKLDTTELPWLAAEGWAPSSLVGVSYHGVRETRHTEWSGDLLEDHYGPGAVYEKTFPAGAIELRGNNGGDGSYVIFVGNPAHPITPPEPAAGLWEPVLGSENGERVKCNNNVNMEYVADQAACQQVAINNGHPFYSFRHNGESSGHKCMSSAHCDDHMTGRTNEWHIYSAGGYHYGVVSSNECETHDVTEAECLAAVQSLLPKGVVQGRTHLVAGSWGWVPTGCSVQSHFTHGQNGDWAAHYNRGNGNNDGGYTPVCNLLGDEWTVVQGAATSPYAGVNVGADAFNAMFAACPVVRYTNPSMTGSPAVYARHGGAYSGDAHSMFTYLWVREGNQFHTDFDIYPSLADVRANTNAWQYCNFSDDPEPDHFNVGFPRDCGPVQYQPHIWFHATSSSGTQTQGYFEIYTGGNCPV